MNEESLELFMSPVGKKPFLWHVVLSARGKNLEVDSEKLKKPSLTKQEKNHNNKCFIEQIPSPQKSWGRKQ